MKRLAMILVGMIFNIMAVAQDVQFSQFYAAPVFLNPAFAGASEMTRFGVNYRNQWPGLNHSFQAYSAYVDHYFFNINSGVAVIANGSRETMSGLNTSEIGMAYSYRLRLGFDNFLRFGGQASFVSRDANFENLVFGSQIDQMTGTVGDFSGENFGPDVRHRYVDYNVGMLFNNDKLWLGLSAHHITQPNISFVNDNISKWPVKYSAHGGVKFDLSGGGTQRFMNQTFGRKELLLAFNYKNQQPFQQLDLGAQINIQPLVVGVWYRGLPTPGASLPNNESLIGVLGISLGNGVDIGYSYDFTLSRLGVANTGGAHEVSMRFSFLAGNAGQGGRKVSSMPCFKY